MWTSEGRRHLFSADLMTFIVRWTYSHFGDGCFVAVGPNLYKSLPSIWSEANLLVMSCLTGCVRLIVSIIITPSLIHWETGHCFQ